MQEMVSENIFSTVIIISRMSFRVNLHSIAFAWMSRNSLLEAGAISEV